MKKYVLVYAAVLTLLMSTGAWAQKSFPDNPNQGYLDTGIGKGDLIQIVNEGKTSSNPTINKIAYADSLIWQLDKDDKRIYFWHIDSLSSNPSSFNALGSTLFDVDIVITEDFFITGGRKRTSSGSINETIEGRLKSNPSGPLLSFNPNAYGLWGTIDELFNAADDPFIFHAFDSTNNRIVNYSQTASNQITLQGQLFLNGIISNSANISGLAALSDTYFIVNADTDSLYKVDLLGQVIASYSPNTHDGVPGTNYEMMRPFIEPNGRLTITMIDTTTNGSQNPDQYLLFLTDELELLDILELPSNGSRGEYGIIQEVVVDDYGNIYVSDDISLELKQLEYFNHAPLYVPVEGPKTILNAANFNHDTYLLPDAFLTDPEDYFDWNVNEALGGIKITDIIGANGIRYDADGNGSFETGLQPGTEYEITIEELVSNRLNMDFNEDITAEVDYSKIVFQVADRAGVYTGVSDTLFINTYKSAFEFDGEEGKDSWQLMAPVIDEVTIGNYLIDLEMIEDYCTEECGPNDNIVPEHLLMYNPLTEQYENPTSLDDTLYAGNAFFMLVPEDTDTSTAGVQDGWPRIEYLDELERPTFPGSDYVFDFSDETVLLDLVAGNTQDTLKRVGMNIVGNPFGQSWRWSNEFAEKVNVSNDIAVWNPFADSGYGAWEFPTFPSAGIVTIKPGEAFAVFATGEPSSLGFTYEGTTTDAVRSIILDRVNEPHPKLEVSLTAEDGAGDVFHALSDGRYIVKPLNPSSYRHEIFGIAQGSEIPTTEVFSKPQDFDTLGTYIPFSIRSGRVDTAYITLAYQDLPDFDSVYVRQITSLGDTLKIFGDDGFEIPLVPGEFGYQPDGKLELVLKNEAPVLTSVNEEKDTPSQLRLDQNYPNPFNPSTNITFSLPKTGDVRVQVFDLLGKHVSTLVDGTLIAGEHSVRFDGSTLSSGIYIYLIDSGNTRLVRKMVLVK